MYGYRLGYNLFNGAKAQQGALSNQYTIPDGYIHPMLPDLSIIKTGGIPVIENYTSDDFRVDSVATVKYVDGVNGSDSNDGDTEQTAYKTFYKGHQVGADRIIIITGGLYVCPSVNTLYNRKTTYEVICTGSTPATIFSGRNGDYYSWTDEGSGVFSFTLTFLDGIVDYSQTNEDGDPLGLQRVSSLAVCQSTLNSYFVDATASYVNLGRQPDIDVAVVRFQISASDPATDINIYFENVSLLKGVSFSSSLANKITFVAKDCKMLFDDISDMCDIDGNVNTWFENCTLKNAYSDGFNYHENGVYNPASVELNCIAKNLGKYNTSGNNNATTAHESSVILRLNGDYSLSEGPVVHDINTAMSLNIKCVAGESTSTIADNKSAWAVSNGGSQVAKMWLDECTGGSETTFGAENRSDSNASKIYARNSQISNIEPGTVLEDY